MVITVRTAAESGPREARVHSYIVDFEGVDVWLTCIDRVAWDRVATSAAWSRPDLPREAQQRSPDGCESADGAVICPRSAGHPCSFIHRGELTCG